jgi:hypothetical protein
MDGAGIAVAELGLRQPTLDDVFLAITGRTAKEESGSAGPSKTRTPAAGKS